MRTKTSKLLIILLCLAPLALAACQNHEPRGDEAASSSSSEEHPGEGESTQHTGGSSDSDEHPGEE